MPRPGVPPPEEVRACAIENFPPGAWKILGGLMRVHVQEREAEVIREMRLDSIWRSGRREADLDGKPLREGGEASRHGLGHGAPLVLRHAEHSLVRDGEEEELEHSHVGRAEHLGEDPLRHEPLEPVLGVEFLHQLAGPLRHALRGRGHLERTEEVDGVHGRRRCQRAARDGRERREDALRRSHLQTTTADDIRTWPKKITHPSKTLPPAAAAQKKGASTTPPLLRSATRQFRSHKCPGQHGQRAATSLDKARGC